MKKSWGMHWFRRDLRLSGNPAFLWNREKHEGRVLGIFSFDPQFLARPDFSVNRFGFFLDTLAALQTQMREAGGDLLVLDQGPDACFEALIRALGESPIGLPTVWSWNRDYEPFAISRDARIQSMLETRLRIPVHTERDHLLIEPTELCKADEKGTFYQVYTPFKKKWLAMFATLEIQERLHFQATSRRQKAELKLRWPRLPGVADALDTYRGRLREQISVSLPPAGESAAWAALQHFEKKPLEKYAHDRDFPAIAGTSQVSIYLKNGSITVPQILAELDLPPGSKFREELIWREFYYHILAHVPRVESTAFRFKYEKLPWENHSAHLEAWKNGQTGFPIVDAGMRQLNATGWMHNRVRMIVASFLTKDLHCDWKLGERYFMEKLLDGDLAPNNGGWQWAASTGCDPQPYFRIFNPTLQSKRFDPQGEYLRRWIPELRDLPTDKIHEPWAKGDPRTGYPRPIVDHAIQSRKAVALYRAIKE